MESSTKVMLAIGAVIGAGVAAAVILVLVMRIPPPPDTGEVTLLMTIRDMNGSPRTKFAIGETMTIELSIMNGKSHTIQFEGASCVATSEIYRSDGRLVYDTACPGDWVHLEIPPGPYLASFIDWDQTCHSDCGGTSWGQQVPQGEYNVEGTLQGSISGEKLVVRETIQII